MAKSAREQIVSDIANIVADTYEAAIASAKTKVSAYLKQIEVNTEKAQAYDTALRYLDKGVEKVSVTDEKKYSQANVRKLETVVRFNKRYKAAQTKAKKVAGLERAKAALEKEKSSLQTRLTNQKERYDKKIEGLNEKYAEADFVKSRLEVLRKKPLSVYEKALKDEKALDRLRDWTYYKGQPTEVTYELNHTLQLYILRDEMRKVSDNFMSEHDAAIEGKSPDDSDDGSNGGSGDGGAKRPKRKNKAKKKKK